MTPAHYLHIYQKPALGDGFLKSYPAFAYKHEISFMGGFDSANCELDVSLTEAQDIMKRYVGNRVAIFVDNPIVPAWEGYIESVSIENGQIVTTRSMASMANFVRVLYSDETITPQTDQTGGVSNLESRAIYGRKGFTYDMGELYDNGTAIATVLRDLNIDKYAWPLTTTSNSGGGAYRITVNMKGFFHTLEWEMNQNANGTLLDASAAIEDWLIDASYNLNAGLFFSTSNALIEANAAFQVERQKRLGETNLEIITKFTEAGDGTNKWVWGITGTNPNTGDRDPYYRQANTDITYHTNYYRDGKIRTPQGRIVNPWDVRPDGVMFIEDFAGWDDNNETPREIYLERIQYDSAAEKPITWVGEDDNTLEGLFQFYTASKSTGSRFGATKRQARV